MSAPENTALNHPFALKSILEREKLNGANFNDWYRNLRIVLKMAKRLHVLETEVPEQPQSQSAAHRREWTNSREESDQVSLLMLACMESDIQRGMENVPAFHMITQLKALYETQARQERFEVMQKLTGTKMAEGTPVSAHVLKLKGYLDQLERIGNPMARELAGDIILNSLTPAFSSFVVNYNMNGWDKTIFELHNMLKTAENNLPKKLGSSAGRTGEVLAIRDGGVRKKGKAKGKKKGKTTTDNASSSNGKGKAKVKIPASDRNCYFCKKSGHWQRNCPEYLATKVKKLELGDASGSGILNFVCLYFLRL